MAECPTCHTACPDAARFCPACGQTLTSAETAFTGPSAADPATSPQTPPQRGLRWGWWLLGGLSALLLGLLGGGWLWLERTASVRLPSSVSAKVTPAAPIELAPGLTLRERQTVETSTSPAPVPAPPPASPALPAQAAPAPVAPAPVAPAQVTTPAPVAALPGKPAASQPQVNPEASRRQALPPSSQTAQLPPEPATTAPSAPVPAAAAPSRPDTQALHDEIVRRKEALKRQIGVE